jgi:hypothetical protein
MIFSKPCERKGCRDLITAKGPKGLAKRRFCSTRCAALLRIANGTWCQPSLTVEQRSRGGRVGGQASGETRRRRAAVRIAAELEQFLTPEIREALSPQGVARLRALFARAWKRGWTLGVLTRGHRQRKQGQAA